MLAANRPTTIVPLDATDDLPLSRGFYLELAANRDTEASKLAWEVLDRSPFLVEGGQSFWDQLAAVTLIDRGPVTFEPRTVRVETTDSRSLGRTVVDAAATRADVAVAADEQAFRAAFISGLNGGRAVASPPASPPTIRFAFDGTTCTPTLPPDLAAGFVAIELENRSKVAAGAGIILLPDGMTAADVERLAREDPNALGTIQGSQTGTGASPGATSRDVGVIGAGRHAVACISYEPTLAIIGIRDVEVAP